MKKLTLENKNELEPYIRLANYNEYNSNIVTMLMWSSMYEVHFEVFEHFALAYTNMVNRGPIWLMPYCEYAYRKEAMEKIAELSSTLAIPYEIHSMTIEFKNWLQQTYPNEFLFWDCYDARDYIYDRKQQQTLTGKKMQKRRNHFHAFEKEYEGRFQYKALEEEDIVNIFAFMERWKANKNPDDSIDAEEHGIHLLLAHRNELPIQGGCIYIDGVLEAFNITSRLASDTVQIHVEKANRNIRGLYIAILKYFLETLDDDILYLNREDDMGLSKLRKAKSDMQPVSKIRKLGCSHQKIEIGKASIEYLSQIEALWKMRFQEENEATSAMYFQHFFHLDECYILTSQHELISMMQTRKMNIMLHGKPEEVSFVVGVATKEEYEGCSYMKQLMNYVFQDLQKTQRFMLLQAYEWDIYKPLGFEETYQFAKTKLDKTKYISSNSVVSDQFDTKELLDIYQGYTKHVNGWRIRNNTYYEQMIPYYALWDEHYFIHRGEHGADAYIRYHEGEQEILVKECIFIHESGRDALLSFLCQNDKKVYVNTDIDTTLFGRRKLECTMMVKSLQHDNFPSDDLYINEEL